MDLKTAQAEARIAGTAAHKETTSKWEKRIWNISVGVSLLFVAWGLWGFLQSPLNTSGAGSVSADTKLFYWFEAAALFVLFFWLAPKKEEDSNATRWMLVSVVVGFAGFGMITFNESTLGIATKQDFETTNRCAAGMDCIKPDIRVFVGEPSEPIANIKNTCLSVDEVNRSGQITNEYAEYRRRDDTWTRQRGPNSAMRIVLTGKPGSFIEYSIRRTPGKCPKK